MRFFLSFAFLLLCCGRLWAEPVKADFLDWSATPEEVMASLKDRNLEAKLVGFHKTGVPYIKVKIPTLGNIWEGTVYFDENDQPNQLLLQLDDVTRSGVTRVQKLAIADHGDSYKSQQNDGPTRRDTLFTWQGSEHEISLTSAYYHKPGTSTMWLKVRPRN